MFIFWRIVFMGVSLLGLNLLFDATCISTPKRHSFQAETKKGAHPESAPLPERSIDDGVKDII
ncbi:hypothetical protein DENIS_3011 [Desulfonema ishimotonii]|uniref:Uncharacterized protein n=1 Tax=Desulfonema ishimotonii TaxID=45657 RepID=A0A401FYK2_9BACT|nr:hypothetical protein DENIS_3011 [Desulfonema ishimotonii]